MMDLTWPKRIDSSHVWVTLRNGRQTAFPEGGIATHFWPTTQAAENVQDWPVCPRFYQRSADPRDAEPGDAGLCRPAWLDRTPPRHRCDSTTLSERKQMSIVFKVTVAIAS